MIGEEGVMGLVQTKDQPLFIGVDGAAVNVEPPSTAQTVPF